MRLILISNRAPFYVSKENGTVRLEDSPGGLASGLRTYVDQVKASSDTPVEIVWMGWPGAMVDEDDQVRKVISEKADVHCVYLSAEIMEKFYEGFCNKTIWPLFHYFPAYAVYENENWDMYVKVNKIFTDAYMDIAKPGDVIWIHDYHLMLMPAMIREKIPDAKIGFFLHIPFPSYEVFRLMPSEWRKQILEGLYGSDLIGFHTYDYGAYFLRSTMRILGKQNHMGEVLYNNRQVKIDTFPMGIDYQKYHAAARSKPVQKEKEKLKKNNKSVKLILSIDRQDYSKGILNRLKGYQHFLENNPEWKQKVILLMVVVPSRIGVESYRSIKSQIDELVGNINGKFGNLDWMPIVYQYRSLPFNELIALYNASDIALVTPLRDGMNLIAKEYIASRTDHTGVLILSEMAGAVDELEEAIIINPNNVEEISSSMLHALTLNEKEQGKGIEVMQKRLKKYNVMTWAQDFLDTLDEVKTKQTRLSAKVLPAIERSRIVSTFTSADSRILFLDYDGTLTPYKNSPDAATPTKPILLLLDRLCRIKNTEVVIISGRDRPTLENWFGQLPINLVAEHGILIKDKNKPWQLLKPVRKNWQKKILQILDHYAEKLPGAFVEQKEYSLVFHYRKSDAAFASLRVKELTNHLVSFTSNMDVQLLNGTYALEIRNSGVDKGVAALNWLAGRNLQPDINKQKFIFAAGDDQSDEDLFRAMPPEAFSIKVGMESSYAKLNLFHSGEVLNLLTDFCNSYESVNDKSLSYH